MSSTARSRSWRRVAVAFGLAAALLVPAAVSADTGGSPTGATVTIGPIGVVGKLIANVTVNVTCDPLDTLDPDTWEPTTTTAGEVNYLSVQLLQAQGRTIDSGLGETYGNSVVCDSSTINRIVVPVVAQSSPWRNGGAVASANVFIGEAFGIGSDGGTSGAVTVKLSGR